jgi:hypothetical protein
MTAKRQSSYDRDFQGLPKVDEIWEWGYREPRTFPWGLGQIHNVNRYRVRVTEVKWNGEEWWVASKRAPDENPTWNDAQHFTTSARRVGQP